MEWPKLLEYIDPKTDEVILDLACGTGELSVKLASYGCKIYGIDRSNNSINLAKKFAAKEQMSCDFQVGDAESLPYPSDFFDKIVSSCSLEHFDDDVTALKEMNRVLKLNGYVILSVDSFTYPISNELKEIHRKKFYVVNYYSLESLKEKLISNNFELIKSDYLIRSALSTFVYNYLIIKSGLSRSPIRDMRYLITLVAYPFCFISDKYLGISDKGYTLLVKSQKSSNKG
ncbi:class I SAM-dependent methyltransferase [Methanobacterium sp.]|uniref:class I SAM-dependent methyltransferase n=1 Tax=Methanobacterium sp. TaxID=2164 RepID=UPI0025D37D9D|nr:class I SAM-dependent methyltransferase [Methanobacterium sp.]MBI5459238.1 class I SAM-dependent methyltransferase [Methanobacterium sp.]